jgi:hypothetical protein
VRQASQLLSGPEVAAAGYAGYGWRHMGIVLKVALS